MLHCGFYESDVQIVLKYMSAYFFKVTSHNQETEKVCSRTCLLKNNQVQWFVRLFNSSTSCTHINDLSRPEPLFKIM